MTRGITERPDGVSVETPVDFASTSQTTELPAVDDWGQIVSSTPQPGSQEAIRRSAADADLELDDVWVQPQLYVTTRQFRNNKSIIGRLPPAAKNTLSVAGICHYLCVYRSERGELYQFDFGPFGGDVHSRLLSDTGGEKKSAQENPNATPGHVRERRLNAIPQEGTYLVGRTSMTLEDIRGFNATRDTMYQVNKNDCRHYVNDLCLEGTGVQSVCSKYVRGEVFGKSILSPAALYAGEAASPEAKDLAEAAEKERARRRKARELAVLLPILAVSDLENVPVWDRLGQASTAALLVGVGVRAIPAAAAAPRGLARGGGHGRRCARRARRRRRRRRPRHRRHRRRVRGRFGARGGGDPAARRPSDAARHHGRRRRRGGYGGGYRAVRAQVAGQSRERADQLQGALRAARASGARVTG